MWVTLKSFNHFKECKLYGRRRFSALEILYVQWKLWGHQPVVVIWLLSGVSGRGQISLWETHSMSWSYTISLTHTRTRRRSDKHGQVWLWQDSLAQFWIFVVILSFLQIVKCNAVQLWKHQCWSFITKSIHIKDRTAPKALCISLRKLSRTVMTRYGDKTMALTQMPLGNKLLI